MSIYLDKNSFEELKKKKIGSGTDGTVYQLNKNELVKIYHKRIQSALLAENSTENDTKLYSIGNSSVFGTPEISNSFVDENGIKIYNSSIIRKATRLQKKVKLSSLPKDDVYYNSIYVGCLLNRAKGIELHKLMGMPLKYKLDIMLEIIKSVEELINNHIYCKDICNSPYAKNINGVKNGHSHILVDILRKKVSLIDLDGQSTIYTDKFNKKLYNETLEKLNILFIEFVFSIENYCDFDNIQDLKFLIRENYSKINVNLDRLLSLEMNIDDTKELIRKLK